MGNCQNFCSLVFPGESGLELERQLLARSNLSGTSNTNRRLHLQQQQQQQQLHQSQSIRRPLQKKSQSTSEDRNRLDNLHENEIEELGEEEEQKSLHDLSHVIPTYRQSQQQQEELPQHMNSSIELEKNPNGKVSKTQSQVIRIQTKLWKKDSHMLFDYENSDVKESIFKLKSSGSLILSNQGITFSKNFMHPSQINNNENGNNTINNNSSNFQREGNTNNNQIRNSQSQLKSQQPIANQRNGGNRRQQQQQQQQQQQSQQNGPIELFKVTFESNGKCFLRQTVTSASEEGTNVQQQQQQLQQIPQSLEDVRPHPQSNWVVVKSVQSLRRKGHRLIEGDFIKLGRLKLKVREICHQGSPVKSHIKRIIEENTEVASEHEATEMQTIRSYRNIDDPIIHPVQSSCISGASISSPTARKSQSNPIAGGSQFNSKKHAVMPPTSINNTEHSQQQHMNNLQGGVVGNASSTGCVPCVNSVPAASNNKRASDNMCNQGIVCKICLSSEDDEETDISNPLVDPCLCTGSMKYVHLKCIQQWVKSKISSSHQKEWCLVLLTKHFECELCKSKYKLKVQAKGNSYDIIDYSKPTDGSAYLILEAYKGLRFSLFGVYILRLANRSEFTIGRSQEADVRVQDISVSRLHASFTYEPENRALFLKDRDSKFGTLVLMRDHLEITPHVNQIQIQNGRAIAEVQVEQNSATTGIFASCFSPPSIASNIDVYSDTESDHNNRQ